MPFCKSCGLEIEEDARFCLSCGTPNALSSSTPSQSPTTGSSDNGKTIVRPNPPPYGVVKLDDLPPGFVVDDRYEIKAKVGQGGFGAVYRAYDRDMRVDKALKVIPELIAGDLRGGSCSKEFIQYLTIGIIQNTWRYIF